MFLMFPTIQMVLTIEISTDKSYVRFRPLQHRKKYIWLMYRLQILLPVLSKFKGIN